MEDITYFAPAIRSTRKEIHNSHEHIASQKLFNEIFGAMTGITAIIDKNRQIIYSNNDFLALLGIKTVETVLGNRLGEVISCIHSKDQISGCGTSKACSNCGAVNAILESQKTGRKSMKETRISTIVEGTLKSWDLNISSNPISLAGRIFYVITIQDISSEKRRSSLEKIFFHDLLNCACGLNGLLLLLKEGTSPEAERELINLSEEASRDIIEEITLQRQIRAAENGDLQVKIERLNSLEFLNSTVGKIRFNEVGQTKHILFADNSPNIYFETDRLLFHRVILNLLKNALEATDKAGTVIAGVRDNGKKIKFFVKNDKVIPEDVQMQLFQRSFSTKGIGRGVGTYSIKLLTENYLNGKVSFISNEHEGTVFSIELNKTWA